MIKDVTRRNINNDNISQGSRMRQEETSTMIAYLKDPECDENGCNILLGSMR